MEIPKKIKIGGKTYQVEITENITLGSNYTGEIDYQQQTIRIRPGLKEFKEQVFLHELFHAMYDFLGYKDHTEEVIDRFASALYMIITDNKSVFGGK